jgi:tetratricopeptide (TPR) repeat protein
MMMKGRHTAFAIVLLTHVLIIFTCLMAEASALKEGKKLYDEGRYEEAVGKFREALNEEPDSDIASFDLGAALYKSGKYAEAADAFSRALDTDDKKLEADAVYNIGNARYMLGKTEAESNPQTAVPLYQDALQHYKRAIELDRSNTDARYNYELVKKELQILLERIKNQPPREGEKDKAENQDQKQRQKGGEGGSNKEERQQKKNKGAAGTGNEGQKEQHQQMQEGQQAGDSKKENTDEGRDMSPEEARMLLDAFGEEGTLKNLNRVQSATVPEAMKDW